MLILLLSSLLLSMHVQAFIISPAASPRTMSLTMAKKYTTTTTGSTLQNANLQDSDTATPIVISRRSALVTSGTFLALLATTTAAVLAPSPALAESTITMSDESSVDLVQRIAAQSAAANAAARAKAELEQQNKEGAGKSQALVPAFLFASVGLSLPFFLPNLLRLGTKIMSGGKDDGYGRK